MNDTLTLSPQAKPDDMEMDARAEVARRFSDPDLMTSLVQQAVCDAVQHHKRVGNPVPAMKDGKLVIIRPEDIQSS